MTDAKEKFVGGLDVGTTGCKIAVYDGTGALRGTYYREYDAKHAGGLHEIDFSDVRDGVLAILKEAASAFRLCAVGVTSFGESFAMLDENDEILAPSMLYTDPRGKEQCRRLCEQLGASYLTGITGVMPNQMYSIYKIMWLREHSPEIYAKCRKILLGADYIVYILTGRRKIDAALAARTGAFDIRKKCWCEEIFRAAGVDPALMSDPVEPGTNAGPISEAVRSYLGVDAPFDVVNGAHDQIAAMIGAGVFEPGIAMDGTGTVECIPVVFDDVPDDPALYEGGYSVVPFIGGKYACYAFSFTGGAVLKWFRDRFASEEKARCAAKNENVYAYLDTLAPKSPTGLLALPHFAGAATPYMDNDAKAAFIGLTLETTKYDIYRALMEGTSYEILLNFNRLKRFSGRVRELRATGGGASSPLWLQIKADILGTKLCAMSVKEAGAAGTAALAGVAVGLFSDLRTAAETVSKVTSEYLPNPENAEIYATNYPAYRDLYDALKRLGKGANGSES